MRLHCIGDSHTAFFTGYDRIQSEYPEVVLSIVSNILTYRIGAPLAYNLCEKVSKENSNKKLFAILNELNIEEDFILLCFGEIDCRAHIIRQAEIKNKSIDEVIENCINRYVSVVLEIKKMGFKVGVWNAIPSAIGINNPNSEFPYYGKDLERNIVTKKFNERLAFFSKINQFNFWQIFDILVDENLKTKEKYYFDKVHLNSKLLPIALSKMQRDLPALSFKKKEIYKINFERLAHSLTNSKVFNIFYLLYTKLKRMFSRIKSIIKKVFTKIPLQNDKNESIELTPSYEEKRAIIESYRIEFGLAVLIETGTFMGDTIEYFKNKFTYLYSMELSAELATRAKKRFAGEENIQIIEGDSANVLADICKSLKQKVLFWLDGHYSSEFFYNGEYIVTAKADKNTPIEKELEIILSSNILNVILIDDARLFIGEHDYPTIAKIESIVFESGKPYTVTVKSDIIHIIPNS